MNAILRECEAAVLTNEAIEVHLSYLRSAAETLDKKTDKIDETIDQANRDRIAGDAILAEKIDKTSEMIEQANDRISKVQGSIEGLKCSLPASL